MLPLYEQYRPHTIDDVVGQEVAVQKIRNATARGWNRVFWFVGEPGTGKTTLARIVADQASGHPAYRTLMSAGRFKVETLDMIDQQCRYSVLGPADSDRDFHHAYVIDEAHLLRGSILAELNVLLEKPHVMRNSCWCFTTTSMGERRLFDEDEIERVPFGSRTIPIRLASDEKVTLAFALRCREIAQKHSLDGRDLSEYVQLVRTHHHNLRECLQAIEAGIMLKGETKA